MTIPNNLFSIDIFYDGSCGMCCTFKDWLVAEERAFAIQCLPYQSEKAAEVFPGLSEHEPEKVMVVRTDQGEVFKGAEAWVLCLYSCKHHQKKAKTLSSKFLLPLAMKTCNLIAANRQGISDLFFKKKNKELKEELSKEEDPKCDGGGCKYDA
jgi:predicted DCC family thiol-disulfide oxidoreductase YuxK